MSTNTTCVEKLKAARDEADTWEEGSCYGHAWWIKTAEVHLSTPFYHLRTSCCGEDVSGAPEDTHGIWVDFNFRSRNEKVHLGEPEERPFVQQYLRRLHKSEDVCHELPVCSLQPTMLDYIALTLPFLVILLCCLKMRCVRNDRVRERTDSVDLDSEAASRGMSAELALVSRTSGHGVGKIQQQLQFIRSMDGSSESSFHIHGDVSSMSAGTVGNGAPLPSSWVVGGGYSTTRESPLAPQETSTPAHESSAAAQESTVEVEKTFTNTVEEMVEEEEVVVRMGTIHSATMREEMTEWLEVLSGEKLGITDPSTDDLAAWLKDGRILCLAANAIKPGTIKTIKKGKMPIENITNFTTACRNFGVRDTFSFVDLFEAKNIEHVFTCVYGLAWASRSIAGFQGPFLGRKHGKVTDNRVCADRRVT